MTLEDANGKVRGALSRLSIAEISLLLAFTLQLIFMTSWAVHQESRITATEAAILTNTRRIEVYSLLFDRVEERSRALTERIDRQETPLGRRVDLIDARTLELSAKVLTHEGRINELFNTRR